MARDPYMLLSIQLALMGVVLVVGFFFVWRAMSRLETRIDELAAAAPAGCPMTSGMCLPPGASSRGSGTVATARMSNINNLSVHDNTGVAEHDDEDDADDDDGDDGDFSIMKACFGNIPFQSMIDEARTAFMMFNADGAAAGAGDGTGTKEGVVLEEITEQPGSGKDVEAEAEEHHEEEGSVAETETNELSKNKLKKMNVDALKSLCVSRGLSTDGLKSALIDRIISSLPSAA